MFHEEWKQDALGNTPSVWVGPQQKEFPKELRDEWSDFIFTIYEELLSLENMCQGQKKFKAPSIYFELEEESIRDSMGEITIEGLRTYPTSGPIDLFDRQRSEYTIISSLLEKIKNLKKEIANLKIALERAKTRSKNLAKRSKHSSSPDFHDQVKMRHKNQPLEKEDPVSVLASLLRFFGAGNQKTYKR